MYYPPFTIVAATQALSKRYGPVRALEAVSIGIGAGQVHGIIGENGAGKSTLMRIMSGLEQPDSGRIQIRGKTVKFRRPIDAQRCGVSMIQQELNLIDDLSVAANIFLGREWHVLGWVRKRRIEAHARKLLDSLQCDISASARVSTLSLAQKQMVEIAKAISIDASIVIMDEPTAVLTRREIPALFALIARLKRADVAIIYISHLLREVLEVSDYVMVMRDGRVVESMNGSRARELGEAGLASRMVGRPMSDHFPVRKAPGNHPLLEVRGMSLPGKVADVSFSVKSGEILGFAGLIGAGRTELAEAICGLQRKSGGKILLEGKPVRIRRIGDAVRAGIAYVSEDRKQTGLTLDMSIADNATMLTLREYCKPLLDRHAQELGAWQQVRALNVKAADLRASVGSLSGGNQQKVALAKWLGIKPRVLILDEPTRGVDIGAKEQIYRLIQELAAGGMACILISSELNEVIGLSHRIVVMRGGRIVATLDRPESPGIDQTIMQYAAGVARTVG